MPDVTLIVDGQTVTVPAGTNVVDAARKADVAIPVFCYHPKMKPVGMCRMCLVEVYTPMIDRATGQPVLDENGKPKLGLMMNKLQTGCTTPVSEGMVIKTVSDKVEFAQRGVLEFLLTSHPLDCPVCDKGGECPLQNLTMQWGPGNSRFDYSDKVHFEKPIPLGDLIYLDRERCILCARCVRFQDEIADDPVLGFDNRGRSWEIISKSDPPFDSKFSGNTTDICPVGALTSSDFRFKARVWELRSTPSICPHCPVGCDITLDMRYNDLMRVMPRENDYVNEIWICDKGRYGMRFIESQDRLTTPLVRRNGQLAPATWEEAYRIIGEKFAAIRNAAGADALAGLARPQLPNEDLFLFQKLFREVIGTNNLDHRVGAPGEAPIDDLPRAFGVGSGTNLMTLGKGTSVLVIGADPEEEAPLYVLRLRGIVTRGGDLTVVNSYATKLARSATRSTKVRPGTEPYFALALLKAVFDEKLHKDEFIAARTTDVSELQAALGRYTFAQLVEATGVAEEQTRAAARAFANAENGIIVYGKMALEAGPALTQALANLALVSGKVGKANNGLIALLPGGNSRGALDMGVRPDAAVGGNAVQRPGLAAKEMWDAANAGRLRGMYVAGLNPAAASPVAAQALDALEFLVVQDLFLTETAQMADVVLPAAAFAEREGTVTNAERRVQRFRTARQAPEDVPADWQIFQEVARSVLALVPAMSATATGDGKRGKARSGAATAVALGPDGWDYIVSSDVADEVSRTVPGYNKTSYTSLELTRKSWGRQPNEAVYYDGTSYENSEGVGVQIAALADNRSGMFTLSFRAPEPVAPDAQYPYTLLTPVRAYDGGDWMRGSKLEKRLPPAHVILSVPDAQQLGVGIGERVRVESSAGALELPAQIDAGLAAGVVLLPLVRGASAAAIITGPQTRVMVTKVD
jgi:NADH-quinone oxidoreductase subunit G